jgi:hypothetical protein
MTTNAPKPPRVFVCITCDFKCSNKKDYNRHLSTAKHNKMTNSNINAGGSFTVYALYTYST